MKNQLAKRFGGISFKRKKIILDSIYVVQHPKVQNFKLTADSTSMGFGVFLKKDFLGLNLSAEQQSDVFMNSLIVQMIQVIMILCVWKYAYTNEKFAVKPARSLDMMVARFVASMMMHINVEKDVRMGIQMMKYAVNHSENFNNVVPAFVMGLNSTILSLIVEINVMIILSSLPNILGVVMKYVSLAAIANIPRFYYNSLVEHKMCSIKEVSLKITNFRHNNPLKNAPCHIKLMRLIAKSWMLIFKSCSFYFMPFMAIFLNFKFMVDVNPNTGHA